MHPIRIIRRLHAPIICVLIACLVSAGCKRGAWSEERYSFDPPQDAFVSDDGTLLLSVHVNRKYRKSKDGWHWLIVEPEKADALFDAATSSENQHADIASLTEMRHMRWRDDGAIELWPSILSSGLDHAEPPEGHTGLVRWEVRSVNNGRAFELYPPGELSPPGAQFQVEPSYYKRERLLSRFLKIVAVPLAIPMVFLGAVVILTPLILYWAVFGGPDWGF